MASDHERGEHEEGDEQPEDDGPGGRSARGRRSCRGRSRRPARWCRPRRLSSRSWLLRPVREPRERTPPVAGTAQARSRTERAWHGRVEQHARASERSPAPAGRYRATTTVAGRRWCRCRRTRCRSDGASRRRPSLEAAGAARRPVTHAVGARSSVCPDAAAVGCAEVAESPSRRGRGRARVTASALEARVGSAAGRVRARRRPPRARVPGGGAGAVSRRG